MPRHFHVQIQDSVGENWTLHLLEEISGVETAGVAGPCLLIRHYLPASSSTTGIQTTGLSRLGFPASSPTTNSPVPCSPPTLCELRRALQNNRPPVHTSLGRHTHADTAQRRHSPPSFGIDHVELDLPTSCLAIPSAFLQRPNTAVSSILRRENLGDHVFQRQQYAAPNPPLCCRRQWAKFNELTRWRRRTSCCRVCLGRGTQSPKDLQIFGG